MKLLKGTNILNDKKNEIRNLFSSITKFKPGLGIIINEDDYGSLQYAKQLIKDCDEVGINVFSTRVNKLTDETSIYHMIDVFNHMEDVTSIMIQHPLPEQFREMEKDIINMVDIRKLIDAPYWRMDLDQEHTWPGTPYGIYLLLKYYGIDIDGKHVTIIGRSKTVGMPLSMILTYKNMTVTICHSKSSHDDIIRACENSQIIISAAGCPDLLDESFNYSKDQIIIDVGCNMVNNKLHGDVKFDYVADKVGAITPVPGGIGPMTRTAILTQIMSKTYFDKK